MLGQLNWPQGEIAKHLHHTHTPKHDPHPHTRTVTKEMKNTVFGWPTTTIPLLCNQNETPFYQKERKILFYTFFFLECSFNCVTSKRQISGNGLLQRWKMKPKNSRPFDQACEKKL